jgi:hypothetical protein
MDGIEPANDSTFLFGNEIANRKLLTDPSFLTSGDHINS